jgi:hypothetical protein
MAMATDRSADASFLTCPSAACPPTERIVSCDDQIRNIIQAEPAIVNGRGHTCMASPRVHTVRFNVTELCALDVKKSHQLVQLAQAEHAKHGQNEGCASELEAFLPQPLHMCVQYSIHRPSRQMRRELALVFPHLFPAAMVGKWSTPSSKVTTVPEILIIPTFQQAFFDLVAVTTESCLERGRNFLWL